jgi:hypothetical protein
METSSILKHWNYISFITHNLYLYIHSPCLNKGQYNNAVVTIMTQTWASDEYIYFDNVSLSCFEFPAFFMTDPSPICEASSDIQLNVSPPGGTYSGDLMLALRRIQPNHSRSGTSQCTILCNTGNVYQ